jgi:hypothetical protein
MSRGLFCGALILFALTGCTSVDTMTTRGVNVSTPTSRSCYPQEAVTDPRFGACPGYHEGPSGTARNAK